MTKRLDDLLIYGDYFSWSRLGGSSWTPYKATVSDGALSLIWLNYIELAQSKHIRMKHEPAKHKKYWLHIYGFKCIECGTCTCTAIIL